MRSTHALIWEPARQHIKAACFRLNLGMSDTPNSPRILKWSSRLAEARAPYTRPDNPLKQVLDAKNPLHEHLSGSPELGSAAAAPSLNLVPATPPIGSSRRPQISRDASRAPNGCSEPPPKPWIATKASYDLDRLTPA
ncbi:hypothetical protein FA13DRAFT_1747874 [Coprinellus micaceus]|uniref:Uncharacterized protein n=1 Tax=Coprinellus micaceus TaxID=71717 RepID=A0A4Y7S0L7_COPMI|nr:hypothetical protein FA13DRAFT_1747874 [Coprinellus micaceus]